MMKRKKLIIAFVGLLLILSIIFAAFLFTGIIKIDNEENIVEPTIEIEEEEHIQPKRDIWLQNKNINLDYIGELSFDSGLIDKSFVQASSVYDKDGNLYHFYNENGSLVTDPEGYTGNDVYIWTNWKDMSYDYNILGGSVFMDYRNVLDDQNIIIYGHHFSDFAGNDPKRIKAFTPLEKLLDENNYKDNKIVRLTLDNETRTYELVGVYEFNANDDYYLDKLQYYRTQYNYDSFEDIYDENYYDNYISAMNSVKLYETDTNLTSSDNTLTLQTCISGYDGVLYEICVFKQINIDYYD